MILISHRFSEILNRYSFFEDYKKDKINNKVLIENLEAFKDSFVQENIDEKEIDIIIRLIKRKGGKKAEFLISDAYNDPSIKDIILIRMDDRFPEEGIIKTWLSSGKGDIRERIRDTLHFALNTAVAPIEGTFEILMGKTHSWEACKYAILIPLKDVIFDKEEYVLRYEVRDTFMIGDLKLPKSTIIVAGKSGYNELLTKKIIPQSNEKQELNYLGFKVLIYPDVVEITKITKETIRGLGYKDIDPGYNPHQHYEHWTRLMEVFYLNLKYVFELLSPIVDYIKRNKNIMRNAVENGNISKAKELTKFLEQERQRINKLDKHTYWLTYSDFGTVIREKLYGIKNDDIVGFKKWLKVYGRDWDEKLIRGQIKFYAHEFVVNYSTFRYTDDELTKSGISESKIKEYREIFSPLLMKCYEAIQTFHGFLNQLGSDEWIYPQFNFKWPRKYAYYTYPWEK